MLLGEAASPGCIITARPVCIFWMDDEHGPDAKILAVPTHDPRYAGLRDLPGIPAYLRAEIRHFFDVYKELEPGKGSGVRGWRDRAAAERGNRCRPRTRPWRGTGRAGSAASSAPPGPAGYLNGGNRP